MRIEAIFGGLLALFVLGIAIYAVGVNQVGPAGGHTSDVTYGPSQLIVADNTECQCYNEAFKLAGSEVGVMSSQYRTGFEQCRAILGAHGGNAWTAGWNARLSSRPYEASCRSYKRGA